MQIGTNFPTRAEYPPDLQTQIDAGCDPFAAFAAAGVDTVELSLKKDRVDRAALEADIDALREHGIQAHVHPYFNCRNFGTKKEPSTLRPNVMTVLNVARHLAAEENRPVVVNFHAASSPKIMERTELLKQSCNFHRWLLQMVDELGANVIVTTEHQLPPAQQETKMRIGDSFQELLTLASATPHPKFGVCWDMGHSVMRHLYHRDNPIPPPNFLPLVKHVHIHDVDYAAQKDHRWIGTGQSPLRKFVQALLKKGYAGAFTMEYSAQEMFNADYAYHLRQSKNMLLDMVPRS